MRRGDTVALDQTKSSHPDVLWAIHHGYLEIVDNIIGQEPMSDVVCFVNCTKRTLTGKMFSKPLDPSRSIVVKKTDLIFNELIKMVDKGKLKIDGSNSVTVSSIHPSGVTVAEHIENLELKEIQSKNKNKSKKTAIKKVENNTDIYANKKDEKAQYNKKISDKNDSGIREEVNMDNAIKKSNALVMGIRDPIFVDMNGEVS